MDDGQRLLKIFFMFLRLTRTIHGEGIFYDSKNGYVNDRLMKLWAINDKQCMGKDMSRGFCLKICCAFCVLVFIKTKIGILIRK